MRLTFFQWSPLGSQALELVVGEMQQEEARTWRSENGNDDERLKLIMPGSITGIGQLRATIANFVADSDAMWVSDKEAKHRPIATRLLINIYDYLHDGDFIEYSKKLSIDERQDVVYHFFSRLDRFMAKMVTSGDE